MLEIKFQKEDNNVMAFALEWDPMTRNTDKEWRWIGTYCLSTEEGFVLSTYDTETFANSLDDWKELLENRIEHKIQGLSWEKILKCCHIIQCCPKCNSSNVFKGSGQLLLYRCNNKYPEEKSLEIEVTFCVDCGSIQAEKPVNPDRSEFIYSLAGA